LPGRARFCKPDKAAKPFHGGGICGTLRTEAELGATMRKSGSIKYAAALLVFAGLITAAVWFWLLRPPAVDLAAPSRGPAVEAVYATGSVEPVYWAKVSATVLGRITSIPHAEGDTVKAGDVLYRLDDREAKAQLAQAEAREKFLQADLLRISGLVQRNVVSTQAYQRALSDHSAAVAETAAARKRLADLTLRSPMSGEILRLDGRAGEVVKAGDVLAWVGKCCPMRIEAEVDEEDIPRVKTGQPVLIRADAFPNRAFDGTVTSITPKGDPINKTYRVRIELKPDQPLQIGMTTEVNIVVRNERNALLVPATAVRAGGVFVYRDGAAAFRPLKLGVFGDRAVEVLEGLKPGERVIVNPPATLKDGDAVRVAGAG